VNNGKCVLALLALLAGVPALAFTGNEDISAITNQLDRYPELIHVDSGKLPSPQNIDEARQLLLKLKKMADEPGYPKAGADYRNFGGGGNGDAHVAFYLEQSAPAQVFMVKAHITELINLKHDITVCEPFQDMPAEERAQKLSPTPMQSGGWDKNQPRRGCYSRSQIKSLKPHYNAALSVVTRLLNGMLDQLPVTLSAWNRPNFIPFKSRPGNAVEIRPKPEFVITPNPVEGARDAEPKSASSLSEQERLHASESIRLKFVKGKSDMSAAAKAIIAKAARARLMRQGRVARVLLFYYPPAFAPSSSAVPAVVMARAQVVADLLHTQKAGIAVDLRVSKSPLPAEILEMRWLEKEAGNVPDTESSPALEAPGQGDGLSPESRPNLLR